VVTNFKSQIVSELLLQKKEVVMEANGRSMFPTMVKGDKIHLQHCLSNEVKVGDIVFGKFRETYCIHRVISTHPLLLTKGDSLEEVDPPIEEVFAKVKRIQRTWISRLRRMKLSLQSSIYGILN
jgi:hypothetical protein